jgi:hypothetical protein
VRLERVAKITSHDVAGLRGAAPVPGWVARQAEAMSGGAEAVLDAICGPLPARERPWVPELPPITTRTGVQPAEKEELPSQGLMVDGGEVDPVLIAEVANVSWPSLQFARDGLLAVMGSRAIDKQLSYTYDQLLADAGTAADFPAALATLTDAGYPPSYVVGSAASWAANADGQGPAEFAGLPVRVGGLRPELLVVSSLGVYLARSEPLGVSVFEPAVGGAQVVVGS